MLSSNGKLEVEVVQGFYLTVRNSDNYLHLVIQSDGEIIRYHNNNNYIHYLQSFVCLDVGLMNP